MSTWREIRAAFASSPPEWKYVHQALKRRSESGECLFGNAFYPATLKSYRRNTRAPWRGVVGMSAARREVVSLGLLCDAIPNEALAAYESNPSGATFARWYDEFMENVAQTTRGVFSDYSMKCVLDLMVCSGAVSEQHLTRWPLRCPGYKKKMQEFFGTLHESHWLRAFFWMHRDLSLDHGGALQLPEVLMHLCWAKKRDTGRLQDCP